MRIIFTIFIVLQLLALIPLLGGRTEGFLFLVWFAILILLMIGLAITQARDAINDLKEHFLPKNTEETKPKGNAISNFLSGTSE